MTPHLASMIHFGTGPNPQASSAKKVFILVKPNSSFYTELNEAYLIHIIEQPQGGARKVLHEIKLQQVESILMKNMMQKQFVISWNTAALQGLDVS